MGKRLYTEDDERHANALASRVVELRRELDRANRKRVDWREAFLAEHFANIGHCPHCLAGAEAHEAINVDGRPFVRCLMSRAALFSNGGAA